MQHAADDESRKMKNPTLLDGTPIDETQFRMWLDGLRSLKFRQTRQSLQDIDGFCCLGVACQLLIKPTLQHKDAGGFLDGGLPIEQPHAPEWLKRIDDEDGVHGILYGPALTTQNDHRDFCFTHIADELEKMYIGTEPSNDAENSTPKGPENE